jgi:nucleotidyltransferase/DNA polymerase involved in DNA repair
VCTANYVARKYGVRSAIPTFIAVKLCPDLVLIPPDFTKYKKYSNIFRDILRKFDKEMESMGLD